MKARLKVIAQYSRIVIILLMLAISIVIYSNQSSFLTKTGFTLVGSNDGRFWESVEFYKIGSLSLMLAFCVISIAFSESEAKNRKVIRILANFCALMGSVAVLIMIMKSYWHLGVFVDEHGLSPDDVYGGLFWHLMGVLNIALLVVLTVVTIQTLLAEQKSFNTKWVHWGICALAIALLIVIGVGRYGNPLSRETEVSSVNDDFSEQITDINQLIHGEVSGFVYFGSDTSPNCLAFNAALKKVKTKDITIYKFDTDFWRQDEQFQKALDTYNVETMPVLLKIESNTQYEKFMYQGQNALAEELKEFLGIQ